MKQAKSGNAAPSKPTAVSIPDPSPEAAKPPVQSAPAAEIGPDKFFMAFGSSTTADVRTARVELPSFAVCDMAKRLESD